MGALLSLNLASNDIGNYSGTGASKIALDALGEALKGNTSITELNMSTNKIKGKDVQGLATGIKDNGALIKLDISSNSIVAAQGEDLQRICAAGGIELVK
jgi:hypothetical protein